MNKSEKVACVLVTYRREVQIVERALKSIVNQTYSNLDIAVVNDYPEDLELSNQLKEMVGNYPNVKYISYAHNSGACVARNAGARATEGKYIAYLDDDDEWVLDKIEKQVARIESGHYGMVYGPFYLERDGKQQITHNQTLDGNVLEALLSCNFIGGTSVPLIRKDIVDALGGFDQELQSSQDYDLWIRIAADHTVGYVDAPMIIRYFSEESITTNLSKKKQGWTRVSEKHAELFRKYPKSANIRLNNIVNQAYMYGDFSYAFSAWKQALRCNPLSLGNVVEPAKGIVKFLLKRKTKW